MVPSPGLAAAEPPDLPELVATPRLADLDRANLLALAWERRDVDELAALAAADKEASLAGSVLAAAAAMQAGDPRAYGFLQAAFLDGRDPTDDLLLAPYLAQITFHAEAPDLGLAEDLPCTRTAIGCALACAERAVSDSESAYSVLLDLDETALVRVLRAQAALDIDWPSRALRSAWLDESASDFDQSRYGAALAALEGFALVAAGAPESAITALSRALELLQDTAVGGNVLRHRVLFERAAALSATGDVSAAWSDLTSVLADDPAYPGAAELLKQL